MKKKLRIFSNIAIICLSVCMFAFGVYAANQVSVTTSGTVTFNATGVFAQVTRTVTGAVSNPAVKEQPINASATEGGSYAMNEENESLTFKNASAPIVLSFEIENLATEPDREIYVTVSEGATLNLGDNVVASVDYLNTPFSISIGQKIVVDIMLYVKDANKSVKDVKYDYVITLTNNLGNDWYVLTPDDVTLVGGGGQCMIESIDPSILSSKSKIIVPSYFNDKKVMSIFDIIGASESSKNSIITNLIVPIEMMIGSGEGPFFDNCTALTSFAMTCNWTNSMGEFGNCKNLSFITIAETSMYVAIGENTNLETIILPKSTLAVSIASCANLKQIFYKESMENWNSVSDPESQHPLFPEGLVVYCSDGQVKY